MSTTQIIKTDAPVNKCDLCHQSKCCRYATERLTTPRSMRDFDILLWQVSHKSIHIYQDDFGWFLQVMSDCEHLLENGLCGIYETRPIVCREHDNEHCDYDIPLDGDTKHYFTNYEQLNAYCKKRFKSWVKRF